MAAALNLHMGRCPLYPCSCGNDTSVTSRMTAISFPRIPARFHLPVLLPSLINSEGIPRPLPGNSAYMNDSIFGIVRCKWYDSYHLRKMTIPFFSFCSSSACSTSSSFTVTFRYVFSQNLYLVSCVSASENIAVGKYTLPLNCWFSVSFFSEIIPCTLCLKASMSYVHPWYARCTTSPGVVFIPVFSCQCAISLWIASIIA